MEIRKTRSKTANRSLAAMLGIGFGLCIPTNIALAEDEISRFDHTELEQLTAQWWQWAFSIPTSHSPLADQNGGNCMIGQRGSIWFLAGNFGGETKRTCFVPSASTLFFPVINAAGYNSPNCAGQGPENLSVKEMHNGVADFIRKVRLADLSVELGSKKIHHFERVRSDVFSITLPAGNLTGNCPAGVYSPAVDEGYYVKLDPLKAGAHTLRIRSTSPLFAFDVTYNLVVVKVLKR